MTTEKRARGRPAGTGFKISPTRVREMQAQGQTIQQIADELGTGRTYISKLISQAKAQETDPLEQSLNRFCDACRAGNLLALKALDSFGNSELQPAAHSLDDAYRGTFSDWTTLDRPGDRPLKFYGTQIRDGSTRRLMGTSELKPPRNYWEIRVYLVQRTDDMTPKKRFAVSIEYHGEVKRNPVREVYSIMTDVPAAEIRGYDPLKFLRGYPKGPRFAERQKKLEDICKHQYGKLVTEMIREPF